jgi:hypothetical protein
MKATFFKSWLTLLFGCFLHTGVAVAGPSEKQKIGLNDLTVSIKHLDRATLLSDWVWLIGAEKHPVLVTLAGDAFVQDKKTGGVYFLDTLSGKIEPVSNSGAEFQAKLEGAEFMFEYFSVELLWPLLGTGKALPPGKLYSFKIPPILGGEQDAKNLELADISVHFSILGQVMANAKSLPVGAKIEGFKLADPK